MDKLNFKLGNEVKRAKKNNLPIVALETTIVSHGMPYPQNIETALNAEKIIKKEGATPATIGIVNGIITVGMSEEEIHNFGKEKNKNSPKSAKMGSKNFYRAVKFLKRVGMQEFRSFLVFLLAGELFILLDILSGDVFHCFIGKENWHGNLKNDNPLGPGEGANVENHWHGVNIKNDEMEGHRERDGAHEQRVLRRWHDEERLVLRN